MKTNNNQTSQPQNSNMQQGTFVDPKIYKKGDYLILVLPGNVLVRKHVNYFKKILDVPFAPVAKVHPEETLNPSKLA